MIKLDPLLSADAEELVERMGKTQGDVTVAITVPLKTAILFSWLARRAADIERGAVQPVSKDILPEQDLAEAFAAAVILSARQQASRLESGLHPYLFVKSPKPKAIN